MRTSLCWRLLGGLFLLSLTAGCGGGQHVVVYSSVDKEVVEPLVAQFEKETGIKVELVSDAEKAKSSGLLARLIEEKGRPRCDVFFSEGPVRTGGLEEARHLDPVRVPRRQGTAAGVLRSRSPLDRAGRAGSRAGGQRETPDLQRRHSAVAHQRPDLADPPYQGVACIGDPLFGTTTVHCLAIFRVLGEARAKGLFDRMEKNKVAVLDSDGDVQDRVEKGDFAFGLTDNDDAMSAIRESKGGLEGKIKMMILDDKGLGLLVPDAPVLIKNGPNPENGKKFIDFILRPATELELGKLASQIPLREDLKPPRRLSLPAAGEDAGHEGGLQHSSRTCTTTWFKVT